MQIFPFRPAGGLRAIDRVTSNDESGPRCSEVPPVMQLLCGMLFGGVASVQMARSGEEIRYRVVNGFLRGGLLIFSTGSGGRVLRLVTVTASQFAHLSTRDPELRQTLITRGLIDRLEILYAPENI